MKAFFQTIILICGFTGLIILYFALKTCLVRSREKRASRREMQNSIARRAKQNIVFFSALIDKVLKNDILWFEVTCEAGQKRAVIQKAPHLDGLAVCLKSGMRNTEIDALLRNLEGLKRADQTNEFIIPCDRLSLLNQIFSDFFDIPGGALIKFKY